MTTNTKQSGHVHLIVLVVLVIAAIGGVGYYVYHRTHQTSKITDAATRAELKQTADEIKKLDLGSLAKSVNTITNVKGSFDYKAANGK
ncbi:MAG TPA: hypothetical protein VHD60_02160 [Candidatus Saccharimonadales bacterium]|nr:hypothetical protein [Candidatus Saccharimonadales bacterium]